MPYIEYVCIQLYMRASISLYPSSLSPSLCASLYPSPLSLCPSSLHLSPSISPFSFYLPLSPFLSPSLSISLSPFLFLLPSLFLPLSLYLSLPPLSLSLSLSLSVCLSPMSLHVSTITLSGLCRQGSPTRPLAGPQRCRDVRSLRGNTVDSSRV